MKNNRNRHFLFGCCSSQWQNNFHVVTMSTTTFLLIMHQYKLTLLDYWSIFLFYRFTFNYSYKFLKLKQKKYQYVSKWISLLYVSLSINRHIQRFVLILTNTPENAVPLWIVIFYKYLWYYKYLYIYLLSIYGNISYGR